MSRIEIHDVTDNQWVRLWDFLSPERQEEYKAKGLASDVEVDSPIRLHQMGDESTLQLFEVQVPPNTVAEVHSHEEDEIMYVVQGTLELGTRSLGPGSSVFIRGNTLYGFKSGPEGLQFLNFRPRKDLSYRSREEHLAMFQKAKNK